MSIDPPKHRREAKVDLSGLSDSQLFNRRSVIALGERAFGPRWQSLFAEALTREAGRRVGQVQVAQWIAGDRPVPEALIEPIRSLALRLADDMERRAADLRADWAKAPPAEDVEAADAAR